VFTGCEKTTGCLQYGSLEGIQMSLTGLSKRTAFDSKMEVAHLALIEREAEFELISFAFFKIWKLLAKANLQK